MLANASAVRAAPVAKAKKTRSAVTNGKRLHVVAPGDHAWARRFRDVLAEIVSDLGGTSRLSEGQRQIARRCATLSIECEKIEGHAVAGEDINLEVYGQLCDRLGHAFQRLGLRRVPKDITDLGSYLSTQTETADEGTVSADEEGVP